MNFVDTAAYKGMRFETKKPLILNTILNRQLYISIFRPHNPRDH